MLRKKNQTRHLTRAALSILLLSMTALAETKKPPNIVVIMVDDMGYECISANGSQDYKTPFIDKLAAGGARFEQCFANPLCTPSRVKIMTGQYNVRNYVKFGILDRSQTTFAHQLKKAGYATGIAGKWQLDKRPDAAKHFGFDQACLWQNTRGRLRSGTRADSRFPNPQLEINGKEVDYSNGEYGPDVCADFLCDFIETNKHKPFFAYYPMILTHCPFDATPDSADWDPQSLGSTNYKGPGDDKLKKKHFRDMVQYSDKLVGKIVTKLEALGLRENTLIIFTGDNGTDTPIETQWSGRTVVGGKKMVADNGTRVPFVVSWPAKVKSRVYQQELVEFSDIMPTLCEVSGAALPENYPGDGVSLWPLLSGEGTRVKNAVYIWFKGKTWARTVDYGVLLDNKKNTFTYQKFAGHFDASEIALDQASESEKAILKNLKTMIEDLAKAENIRDNVPKKKKR